MRAAIYSEPGGSDVLAVSEVTTPEPGPGEVRVRLGVAGVNPTDWKARAGAAVPFDFQVPGQDGAGVIEAVGMGVDAARVNERVWVYFAAWQRQWGTAAQYTVVLAAQAVPLPGDEKAALARAAGADAVVNYREDGTAERIREAAPHGVDRIVELALGPNLELDLAVAAPYAVISTYAADVQTAEVTVRRLMTPNLVLRFVLVYTIPRPALKAAVEGVNAAVADGALTTLPLHRFALEHAGAAHDAVEGGAVGKVVIDV